MSTPTIKDVAEQAGVSAAAVSLFLNDRPGISQATRERIAAAVATTGYVYRGNGKRAAGVGYVSLLVEELPLPIYTDHFYAHVMRGLHAEAERIGYHLVLSVVDHEQGGLPRVVAEQQAAGILAIGGGDITDELLDRIAEEGMPLVAVDNYSNHRQLDSVVTDDRAGAYLATRHLIELGHRRIAIILGPEKYKPLVERYHGYRDALNEANIPLDPALIQAPLSQGTPQKGYRETERLLQLDPLPTAIFAVSDRTALGALALLQQRGLRVPEDLSLVGFDNVAPGAHAHPALTTVNRPHYEMGIIAMQRLDMLISGRAIAPTKLVLYVDLIERESTAAPPTQSRSSR